MYIVCDVTVSQPPVLLLSPPRSAVSVSL